MGADLPAARVVRDGVTIRPPPRRVPFVLWIRQLFGGIVPQAVWFTIAFMGWSAAFIILSNDDPSKDNLNRGLFVLIALGAGVPLLLASTIIAIRSLRLFRRGVPTVGTLVSVQKRGGGKHSVFDYTFRYPVGGTTHEVTLTTQVREERLEDDAQEPMLYLPEKPQRATTLDHLPGHPKIEADGTLVAQVTRIWPPLILPVLAISGVLVTYFN